MPAAAPKRRGRKPSNPRPRAHPFACATPQLRKALARIGVTSTTLARGERELTLALPSSESGPERSPQLLRAVEERQDATPSARDPWVLSALTPRPGTAVDVLLALPAEQRVGTALGDSLRFAATVAKLALELIARGRLLPGSNDAGPIGWRAGRRSRLIRTTRIACARCPPRCRRSSRPSTGDLRLSTSQGRWPGSCSPRFWMRQRAGFSAKVCGHRTIGGTRPELGSGQSWICGLPR